MKLTLENTYIETWFERDRASIVLYDNNDCVIAEWWDDDVYGIVDDGFLSADDWHGTAVDYLNYLNE